MTNISGGFAKPVSIREIHSDCANCGRPIFTIAEVTPRSDRQAVWRHADNNQPSCIERGKLSEGGENVAP